MSQKHNGPLLLFWWFRYRHKRSWTSAANVCVFLIISQKDLMCWIFRVIEDYAVVFFGSSLFKILRLFVLAIFTVHFFTCLFYRVKVRDTCFDLWNLWARTVSESETSLSLAWQRSIRILMSLLSRDCCQAAILLWGCSLQAITVNHK